MAYPYYSNCNYYNSCYNSCCNRCYNYCGCYYRPPVRPPFPPPFPCPNPGTGSLSAQNNTGATLTVTTAGTLVPLPNQQALNGFTADATGSIFTVSQTGTYRISYQVFLASAVFMNTQILVNGAALAGSISAPVVPTANYNGSVLVTLNAGDTISLEMFNYAGNVTLAAPRGAQLTVVRVA